MATQLSSWSRNFRVFLLPYHFHRDKSVVGNATTSANNAMIASGLSIVINKKGISRYKVDWAAGRIVGQNVSKS
jgi:hypothetical protein